MPRNLPLDRAAPLLCAGITVYSPMKYYGLAHPGLHVGVAGLEGLGHVAVKSAKAFIGHGDKYFPEQEGGSIGEAWCRCILDQSRSTTVTGNRNFFLQKNKYQGKNCINHCIIDIVA